MSIGFVWPTLLWIEHPANLCAPRRVVPPDNHLGTVAVAAGVLVAAGSASAGTQQSGPITYNGHAGLGASVYQHNQTDYDFIAFPPQRPGGASFILMADLGGQYY